jgi:hypothetical protein
LILACLGAGPAPESRPKQVCLFIDRPGTSEAFLRGFKRPFLLAALLTERKAGKDEWTDSGSIPNSFRLTSTPCVTAGVAESLGIAPIVDETGSETSPSDYAVRVRIKGFHRIIVDFVGATPGSTEDIHPIEISLEVAMCSPDSLQSPAEWTPMRVTWRENPSSPTRADEIHGWMVGMATLQVIHRRLGLLPDDDLVFVSRGRNH